jgi:hypothetical protein
MPEKTQVRVTNLATGKTTLYRPRERDGVFVSILPPCQDYKVEYMVGNEAFKTENITIPCEASYQEINKEIYLNPVDLGKSRVVEKDVARNRKWQVLKDGNPYERPDVVVKYLSKEGNVMFTESLEKDGTFAYYKLPKQDGYRFQIETEDPHLCQELELLLVDGDGNEVGRTERTERCNFMMKDKELARQGDDGKKDEEKEGGPDDAKGDEDIEKEEGDKPGDKGEAVASHRRTYDYNEKGLDASNDHYQRFLDHVEGLLQERSKVRISVFGSASKVPTKSFPSNDALAEKRAKDARSDLEEDLKDRGVSLSSIEFSSRHQVQGPPYETGNIRSKEAYMEHQYVRIEVQQ